MVPQELRVTGRCRHVDPLVVADDTWAVSEETTSLDVMLTEISVHAEASIGPKFRWDKCKLAVDGEPKDTEAVIDPAATPMLAMVSRVRSGESLTPLGATIRTGGQSQAEWEATKQKCWAAYHLRRRFWKVRVRAQEKQRMLHMCILPIPRWRAGIIFWTQLELRAVQRMQLQISRRALHL